MGQLLRNLPGIYPAEVIYSLRRLEQLRQIREIELLAIELEAASKPALSTRQVDEERRLIEHPVDFEWRFTKHGVRRICEELERFSLARNSNVLCLGCPSVFSVGKQILSKVQFHLWDKNSPNTSQLEEAKGVRRMDVATDWPQSFQADAVVIDPPWYNDYYKLFLWAALKCLRTGGRVIMSFPPEGTRPSIAYDLTEIRIWCALRGLVFERREPNCLPYRSPLFEVNALRSQGISNYPLDWRRGDLVILKKEKAESFPRPRVSKLKEEWKEIRVCASRIKVCVTRPSGKGVLDSVCETDVIPSVSSRHAWRGVANVVTSGNRFFRTRSVEELISCLEAINSVGLKKIGSHPFSLKNALLVRRVLSLLSKEEQEASQYFRRINEF